MASKDQRWICAQIGKKCRMSLVRTRLQNGPQCPKPTFRCENSFQVVPTTFLSSSRNDSHMSPGIFRFRQLLRVHRGGHHIAQRQAGRLRIPQSPLLAPTQQLSAGGLHGGSPLRAEGAEVGDLQRRRTDQTGAGHEASVMEKMGDAWGYQERWKWLQQCHRHLGTSSARVARRYQT